MSYSIHRITDEIVYIVDNDDGVSVTNSAETVVAELNSGYPNRRVIYRDTMGYWDELVHDNGQFIGFKQAQGPRT